MAQRMFFDFRTTFRTGLPAQTHLEAEVPRAPWTEGKLAWKTGHISGSHISARWDSRGHPRAPNTYQYAGSWGRAHPQQSGRGSESGGEQGREGSHREWQHFHKHPWISPKVGPKQTSSGPGQESKAFRLDTMTIFSTQRVVKSRHRFHMEATGLLFLEVFMDSKP